MPLYHPPKDFVKRLTNYDPLLRVRYSDHKKAWLVERKVRRSRLTYGNSPDPDVRQRTHDGYIHVFSTPVLDGRVFIALEEGDMWRMGGAAALNRKLDEELEQSEYLGEINQQADLRHIAGEMWDSMARKRNARLNMGINPLNPSRINRGT